MRLFSFVFMMLLALAVGCESGSGEGDGDGGGKDTATGTDTGGGGGEVSGEYPAGPYGKATGDTMADHVFRDPAGGTVSLAELRQGAELLLLNSSAGWCTVCQAEAPTLVAWHEEFSAKGLRVVYTLFEDANFAPPSDEFAGKWKDNFSLPFPVLVDEGFTESGLGTYFDPSTAPLNVVVRTSDMAIVYIDTGFEEDVIRARIESQL